MSAVFLPSPWLAPIGWTLLHFLWQGALVAAGLAVALAALRGRSAGARYLVSMGAVVAGLLPLVTFLLLPLPPSAGRSRGDLPLTTFPAVPRPTVPTLLPTPPAVNPALVLRPSAATPMIQTGISPSCGGLTAR